MMHADILLKKKADDVVAEAVHLPLLAITVQGIDHRLWQAVPGATILDEVINHLVQRLPTGFPSFADLLSQLRTSRGTRTLMLDNSIVRGVRDIWTTLSKMKTEMLFLMMRNRIART